MVLHEQPVDEQRSMDADEAVWFERLCDRGDGLANEIRAVLAFERYVISFGRTASTSERVDEQDASVRFDRDAVCLSNEC